MEGRDKLGYFYLDDAYCADHDMHPETLSVFYDTKQKTYVYVAQIDCKNKEVNIFDDKADLLLLLKNRKDSFTANYPEIKEPYNKMLHKVKKYRPSFR